MSLRCLSRQVMYGFLATSATAVQNNVGVDASKIAKRAFSTYCHRQGADKQQVEQDSSALKKTDVKGERGIEERNLRSDPSAVELLPFVCHHFHVEECDSTMTSVKQEVLLLPSSAGSSCQQDDNPFSDIDIIAFTARRQRQGRGSGQRVWQCPEGNLFLTLAIPMDLVTLLTFSRLVEQKDEGRVEKQEKYPVTPMGLVPVLPLLFGLVIRQAILNVCHSLLMACLSNEETGGKGGTVEEVCEGEVSIGEDKEGGSLPSKKQFLSNTLRTMLEEHLHLKWPNDVLWKGQKICGTLMEQFTLPAAKSGSSHPEGLHEESRGSKKEKVRGLEGGATPLPPCQSWMLIGIGVNVLHAPSIADGGRISASLLEICGQVLEDYHSLLRSRRKNIDETKQEEEVEIKSDIALATASTRKWMHDKFQDHNVEVILKDLVSHISHEFCLAMSVYFHQAKEGKVTSSGCCFSDQKIRLDVISSFEKWLDKSILLHKRQSDDNEGKQKERIGGRGPAVRALRLTEWGQLVVRNEETLKEETLTAEYLF